MIEGTVLLDPPRSEIRENSAEPQVRTYCIAGLGNPGVRYQDTPHNIGFKVVDELAHRHRVRLSKTGLAMSGAGENS